MPFTLPVHMRDGTRRIYRGKSEELGAFRSKLLQVLATEERALVTFDLSTEGVMVVTSSVAEVGDVKPSDDGD